MATQNITRRGFLGGLTVGSAAALLAACSRGTEGASEDTAEPVGEPVATESFDRLQETDGNFVYDALADGKESPYSNVLTPAWYIFAGEKDLAGAQQLVGELGLADNLDTYAGTVVVLTPANGESYTADDADAFVALAAAAGPATNVKVIGIDDGATFVAGPLADKLYFVAGVMTYGGEAPEAAGSAPFVPAYLANAPQEIIDVFVAANEADDAGDGAYVNADNELKCVVVAEEDNLSDAMAHAWERVLSKNYRQHNETTEFYMSSIEAQTDPYLLIDVPDYNEVEYIEHYSDPIESAEGAYTWFEYVPAQAKDAAEGTVPLVVSLHGNGNDARIQGDTTGWPELAAQEGFILVAPEWQQIVVEAGQDPHENFFGCDGLEGDLLISWLGEIEAKYPQIDTKRIYITGLSAGGSATTLYNLKYRDVFAAGAAVSAPGIDKAEIAEIAEGYDGPSAPLMYLCGDHDFFGMIPVDLSSPYAFPVGDGLTVANVDDNVNIWPVLQAYLKVNGLDVPETYDLSANEYYGIALENQEWIKLGEKDALVGGLSNADGEVLRLVAIKDQAHWNYKPEAAYMWEFFKNYSK